MSSHCRSSIEQRERMLRPREDLNEALKHQLESSLRLLRRQVGDGLLFSDDQLQLGHEVHDQLSVRAQCGIERRAPVRQLRVVSDQKTADKALQRLHERRVRDAALVLIELAGCEQPTR